MSSSLCYDHLKSLLSPKRSPSLKPTNSNICNLNILHRPRELDSPECKLTLAISCTPTRSSCDTATIDERLFTCPNEGWLLMVYDICIVTHCHSLWSKRFNYFEWTIWAIEWMLAYISNSPSSSVRLFSFLSPWFRFGTDFESTQPDHTKRAEAFRGRFFFFVTVCATLLCLAHPTETKSVTHLLSDTSNSFERKFKQNPTLHLPFNRLLVEIFPTAFSVMWNKLTDVEKDRAFQ